LDPHSWQQYIRDAARDESASQLQKAQQQALAGEDLPESPSNAAHELATQQVADMQANRELRDRYAKYAFRLALGCLIMWWFMIAAQGVGKVFGGVELWSPSVVIAVTTGVTINVLAAFLGVIRGLFGEDA